ncbi:GNAT family N-acetyltransferase [Legionella cincinnatiensis]|uniref:Acetyltransferase (GNAT) family protein n=1 Tax=Legionella cincinnatiensis TaxID=28085 RepID=A0A378IP79_9GAMM|nr:GNAT family N-acetyltransferase [Legionella cincinnatiensis]KTC86234.1 Acetyltransferase (GNAT) family protein [Legionella cincinnatiensis]STX33844.1 N-acetyltransferase ats1 [Legionella cincinnatiensis]
MNQYKVRGVQPRDKESWLTLWNEYLEFYHMSLLPQVTDNTWHVFLSEEEHMRCIVCCDAQDVPVGFLTFILHLSTWSIASECYVHDLYVNPAHRRAGVAKMLMDELKHMSKFQKWSRIYWLTQLDNDVAQNFYNQIGTSEPWMVYVMSNSSTAI